jgi:hypothetical protein
VIYRTYAWHTTWQGNPAVFVVGAAVAVRLRERGERVEEIPQ